MTDHAAVAPLAADRPISTKAEDCLHYQAFAGALARSIVERAPSDGFVIGVQAQWGMGKSSAINLMLEAIRELEEGVADARRLKVRPFNPWLFSGLETLAAAYVSELARVIDETLGDSAPEGTRRFLEGLIRGGAEMVGGAVAVGAVALTGGAAAPGAAALKSVVTGAMNYGADRLQARSLDDRIGELRTQLARIETKILVIVDDLDRLQPDEVRQVLTLVKTFGNLPNVIHLLVYDRSIVDRALGTTPAQGGPERRLPTYLEKIVQVELDLPPPGPAGLRKLTFDRLTAIVGPNPPMEQEDWGAVARFAFQHYLQSPRDVTRLCNALSVAWPAVAGEAYVPDLVAIEMLRHFEPRTYALIRDNRDFVTGEAVLLGEEAETAIGRSITESIPQNRRDQAIDLLCRMFPAMQKSVRPRRLEFRSRVPSSSGRRIGSSQGFDAYFRFSAPPDEIPASELRRVREGLADPELIRASFRNALGRRRSDEITFAAPLLEEISGMLADGAAVEPCLIDAVMEVAEELMVVRDVVADFIRIDNVDRLKSFLTLAIERVPEPRREEALLATASRATTGLHASALLVALLGRDHQVVWVSQEPRDPPLVSRDGLDRIGTAVAERIGRAAETGALDTKPTIGPTLRVWATFAGMDAPAAWFAARLSEPSSALDLAFAQMSRVHSSAPPYKYRDVDRLPEPAFVDATAFVDAIEGHLASGLVPEDERSDAERFVLKMRRLAVAGRKGEASEFDVDDD